MAIIKVNNTEVHIENHTPVTPCPCQNCGVLVQPQNCDEGWGALQTCMTCDDALCDEQVSIDQGLRAHYELIEDEMGNREPFGGDVPADVEYWTQAEMEAPEDTWQDPIETAADALDNGIPVPGYH